MMSFRTMFDPARASGLTVTGAINVGDEPFLVEVKGKCLRTERGVPDAPDFTLGAPVAAVIAGAVYGKVPLAEMAAAGLLAAGDQDDALRFIDLFHLPVKAH
jgi:hypothetical protein